MPQETIKRETEETGSEQLQPCMETIDEYRERNNQRESIKKHVCGNGDTHTDNGDDGTQYNDHI